MSITIASIKDAVARHYHITPFVLVSRQGRREISIPRQIGMALARSLTDHTRATIGHHFGDRDPTTVLHAERATVHRYTVSPEVEHAIDAITKELVGR